MSQEIALDREVSEGLVDRWTPSVLFDLGAMFFRLESSTLRATGGLGLPSNTLGRQRFAQESSEALTSCLPIA